MEDIIYQYPEESKAQIFEDVFYKSKRNRDRFFKKSMIFFAVSLVFLILFSIPVLNKFNVVFLIAFVLCLLIGMHILKGLTASIMHLCGINALADRMTITYYSFQKASKRVYQIKYSDIVKARFSDSEFTSFQIIFKPTKDTFEEDYNDKKERIDDEKLKTNLIILKLNKGTYEQGFFLYVAKSLFEIDKFKASKIEDKYGTAEAFFGALAEREE